MKKLGIFLMLLVCLTLTGCSGGGYTTVTHANGAITETYTVTFNLEYFTSAGATPDQYTEIVENTRMLLKAHEVEERKNFEKKVNTDLENEKLTGSRAEKIKRDVQIKFVEEIGAMHLQYSFASAAMYYYYYNIDTSANSSPEIEVNNFVYKYISRGKTKFYSNVVFNSQTMTLGEFIYWFEEDMIKDICGEEVFNNLPQKKLMYNYVTTNSRLHSDADKITKIGGYYYHTWEVTKGTIDRDIMLYELEANRGNWYITVLVSGIAIVLSIALGMLIYDNRKNHKVIKGGADENKKG